MTKHQVSTLLGPLLDAAVAKVTGDVWAHMGQYRADLAHAPYSTCWEFGGPIIEREQISLESPDHWHSTLWRADIPGTLVGLEPAATEGPTPLIAAMRALVFSSFGEEVDL